MMMDLYVLIAFAPNTADREGDEIVSWLTEVGFSNSKQISLQTHLALIIAKKPTT